MKKKRSKKKELKIIHMDRLIIYKRMKSFKSMRMTTLIKSVHLYTISIIFSMPQN